MTTNHVRRKWTLELEELSDTETQLDRPDVERYCSVSLDWIQKGYLFTWGSWRLSLSRIYRRVRPTASLRLINTTKKDLNLL